jgi:hypothetical protein
VFSLTTLQPILEKARAGGQAYNRAIYKFGGWVSHWLIFINVQNHRVVIDPHVLLHKNICLGIGICAL